MKFEICKKQNLCIDCNSKICLRAGKIGEDCPKYHCDNLIPWDCKNCDFIKEYIKQQRGEYDFERKRFKKIIDSELDAESGTGTEQDSSNDG